MAFGMQSAKVSKSTHYLQTKVTPAQLRRDLYGIMSLSFKRVATHIYGQIFDHSSSSGQYEGGGTSQSGPTEEEMLERDVHRERHKLAELNSALEHQKREIRSTEAELPGLRCRNQETQKELETVNQDLTATRAHAPDEGTMQRGELVNEFTSIIDLANNLVNDFQAWYNQFLARSLLDRRARRIREYLQGKDGTRDADKFVDLAVGQRLKSIAQLLLRHYLYSALIHHVFQPLLPGKRIDDFEATVLREILHTVRKEESQNRSGRWRALMYKQALIQEPRDTTWCTDIATEFVREAFHLMGLVTDAGFTDEMLQTALQKTTQIFHAAAEFKDKAMKTCTEVDFLVYMPHSNRGFEQRFMEEVYETTVASKKVVLGVGLGLQLSHNIQVGPKYVQDYEFPILASTVGERSSLIRQAWY